MPWISVSCEGCGAEVRKYHHPQRKQPRYCTQQCWLARHNTPGRNAEVARKTAEKRGDTLRGRGAGKTYRKRGGKHEHRYVMEQKLGGPIPKGMHVHHIDGDRRNNHPDNLMLLTPEEHIELHRSEMVAARGGDA